MAISFGEQCMSARGEKVGLTASTQKVPGCAPLPSAGAAGPPGPGARSCQHLRLKQPCPVRVAHASVNRTASCSTRARAVKTVRVCKSRGVSPHAASHRASLLVNTLRIQPLHCSNQR